MGESPKKNSEKKLNKLITTEKENLISALCLNRQNLRRELFKKEVIFNINANLEKNLHPITKILLEAMAKKKINSSKKIKKILSESHKNVSAKKLLAELGINVDNWPQIREKLFNILKLSPQKNNYNLPDGRRVIITDNESADSQKDHAILRAILTVIELIQQRLTGRELAAKKDENSESKNTNGQSPEFIFFAQKIRDHLISRGLFNTIAIRKIIKKDGINLYRLLYTLGITNSELAGILKKNWQEIYFRMGLQPLASGKKYKPAHKLINETFSASDKLSIRQKRALLDNLLSILWYLEKCLSPTTSPTSKKIPEINTASIEQKILQKFPHLNKRMMAFKKEFAKAKNYLLSARFQNNLKKAVGEKKYQELVNIYRLTNAGIQLEDYLALVFKESSLRANATTSSSKARGYFQLFGSAQKSEVKNKFKFKFIMSKPINETNPFHNCVIGILYHKILLHNKTDFSNYGIVFSQTDRLKLARIMYNTGYDKIRKIIINVKPKIDSYEKLETFLNDQLCLILGGCSGEIRQKGHHRETKTDFIKLNGVTRFDLLKNDPKSKQKIYIDPQTGKTSLTKFPDKNICLSAGKIKEALEYVQVIAALENSRSLPASLTTLKNGTSRPKPSSSPTSAPTETFAMGDKIRQLTEKKTLEIQALANKIEIPLFQKLRLVRKVFLWQQQNSAKFSQNINQAQQKIAKLDKSIAALEAKINAIRNSLVNNITYQPFLLKAGTGKGEQLNFEIPLAHKFNLPRIWSWQTIDRLKKNGELMPVLHEKTINGKKIWISNNGHYTISLTSFASDYKPYLQRRWKMSPELANRKVIEYFANLRPSTKKFLDEFSTYYATTAHEIVVKKLGSTICPSAPKPLLIGSMTRTRLYQKLVQKENPIAGRLTSGHEFGHTFDISEKSFERGEYTKYYRELRREMIKWIKQKELEGYQQYLNKPAEAIKNKIMLVQYTSEMKGRRFHITAYHANDLTNKETPAK